jgi:hypothetical protein
MASGKSKAGSGEEEQQASKAFPHSDDVLEQAARIASHFALLEYGVRELVHLLLGVPENVARAVMANLSFGGVQNLVSSLVKERTPALASECKKTLRLIKQAEEMKDGVSCFLWGLEMADGERKRRMSPGSGELDPDDLNHIVVEIVMAMHEVERLRQDIQDRVHGKSA